jgi:hypothetical protein
MRNVAFAIWMAGYAISVSIGLNNTNLDDPTPAQAFGAVATLVIWIGVGILLYERKPEAKTAAPPTE